MIEAESARGEMSRAWMNPTFSAGLMNIPQTFDAHSDPETMFQFSLMQRVPWPGKLEASSDASNARVDASKLDLAGARQEMAAMIAMAYYDLAGLIEIDSLLHSGLNLTDEMVQAAERMAGSGMSAQSDVERARLEQQNWRLKIIASRGEIGRKTARLAYLTGLGTDSVAGFNLHLPSDVPPIPNLDSLLTSGGINRAPVILAADSRVNAAESDLARARREWYPDVDVMLAYGIKPYLRNNGVDPMTGLPSTGKTYPDNMISLGITVPIPLFHKGNQEARIAEILAMRNQRADELANAKLKLKERLETLQASWEEHNACCSLVRQQQIERTEGLYRATLIDYRAGKAPFMALSQAQMSLVMAKMNFVMSRADAWRVSAEWNAALGRIQISNKAAK